jgi:unsaturated chondroitin disaccharide hydrolase
MIRKKSLFFLLAVLLVSSIQAQQKPMQQLIDSAIRKAAEQYKYLGTQLPADMLPKTWYPLTKKFEPSKSNWWCSGFYSGTLWYLYEYTKDGALQDEARRAEKIIEKEKNNTGTHDLGFMMYCSFGNDLRLHPKTKETEDILVTSAKSLSTRFNPTIGCIKSWDHGTYKFPVIIDNMMNLELLFWATQHTGDSSFYKIAVTHANTTIKNHYRPDYSSFHVIDYDPGTGAVYAKKTAQGYADYSAWARGQAWGLYGYVVMYRCTKNKVYLNQAQKIAAFLLNHPRLPSDKIPFWDYDTPEIPATYRDASAAAITASALIELSGYSEAVSSKKYLSNAEQILRSLSTPTYTAPIGTNGGFILKHSSGHVPGNSEVDVPLTYADYYYIEALMRYKALLQKK